MRGDNKERTMFNKILWATDGSEPADWALPYVRGLALEHNASVVLVHVEQISVGVAAGAYPLYAAEEEIKAKITKQATGLVEAGIEATVKFGRCTTTSEAAHAIAEAAEAVRADLIVVGTRGHTALGGLLLGSVTQRLLHIAHCPVLAVPPAGATKDEPSPSEAVPISA
jgi:nucleotide-binding universal stress UspA family protein